MVRVFSGHIKITHLFSLVSSASLPLWVCALSAAYWLYSGDHLAALAGFIFLLFMLIFIQHRKTLGT
jgi:hypothetical protein